MVTDEPAAIANEPPFGAALPSKVQFSTFIADKTGADGYDDK
jgi:hypothetical protein